MSNSGYTDTELLVRLRNGDQQSFAEIYSRYWTQLYLHAARMLGDPEEARDVVQEVFLIFWSKVERLPEIGNVRAYLFRMIRNRVLDLLKEQKYRDDTIIAISDFFDTESPDTDSAIHELELIRLIEKEVVDMPSKMREIYELSRVEQLSHKEIAQRLAITVFTVKTQLNNALRRIRARIGHLLSIII